MGEADPSNIGQMAYPCLRSWRVATVGKLAAHRGTWLGEDVTVVRLHNREGCGPSFGSHLKWRNGSERMF